MKGGGGGGAQHFPPVYNASPDFSQAPQAQPPRIGQGIYGSNAARSKPPTGLQNVPPQNYPTQQQNSMMRQQESMKMRMLQEELVMQQQQQMRLGSAQQQQQGFGAGRTGKFLLHSILIDEIFMTLLEYNLQQNLFIFIFLGVIVNLNPIPCNGTPKTN